MGRKKGRQTIFAPTTPTVSIIPEATVDQKVGDAFDNMSGLVFAFAGTTAPSGWLVCNGQAVSRTVYANLFAVIGTSHGDGDGSTTFNLPDYRGRFLRGVDGGAANDPDRASRTAMNTGGNTGDNVGSVQGHAFQTHTHTQDSHAHLMFNSTNRTSTEDGAGNALSGSQHVSSNTWNPGGHWTSYKMRPILGPPDVGLSQYATATNQNAGATGTTSQATANETRPVNANVNYIIKT